MQALISVDGPLHDIPSYFAALATFLDLNITPTPHDLEHADHSVNGVQVQLTKMKKFVHKYHSYIFHVLNRTRTRLFVA